MAVRMGKWKGIKQDVRKNPDAPAELYDLENDISESTNVAADHPGIAARIEQIMLEARTRPANKKFAFGEYGAPD